MYDFVRCGQDKKQLVSSLDNPKTINGSAFGEAPFMTIMRALLHDGCQSNG